MAMVQRQQKKPAAKPRLTAEDWADAALTAIGEGGLAAVAVEPLAVRLGTTKGSFYWHFANRDALVEAALGRWAEIHTEKAIQEVEAEPDPRERVRLLFAGAIGSATSDSLEVALLATASHPQVTEALRRVTERRVAYVGELFAGLGFPPAEAARRGLLAYSVYLGHVQLGHAVPSVVPEGDGLGAYLDEALDALMTR
ncbi:TetR/AcrR family transcriptional regulator [Streptomyces alfalfae]|uniref:TetR family transcriptional regulator n=1 Tax=Streptomyces alfalfae TaxID=1642299 RepID=A0A1P8TM75_9ACTN|nr:TetR family transcriptional regulator [Streptomyces alfalfae]QQC88875.1 TetR/AcrR family transcriptional regulator [Streptomyces alfalfae]QUI31331.1 TetR/AcrR family transcriptional regulator [Streptomyces alfalfae]